MVAQAGSTDPGIVVEIIRAVSPIVAALIVAFISASGVNSSLRHAELSDANRMKHDRELKDMELEAAREDLLRDERKRAYAHLAAATSTIPIERTLLNEVTMRAAESMLETHLVAGSEKVKEAATALYEQHKKTVEVGLRLRSAGKDLDKDTDLRDSMEAKRTAMFVFIDAAREELGIARSTPLDDVLETPTDSRP